MLCANKNRYLCLHKPFMKKIHYFYAILLSFSFCFLLQSSATAQNKKIIDSLQKIYSSSPQDSLKSLALSEIANEYRPSNPDTALLLSKKSYKIAKNINFEKGIAWAALRKADAWRRKNSLDSALNSYKEAQVLFDKIPDTNLGKGAAYNGVGSVSFSQGEYVLALESFEKALFFRKLTPDKMGISISLNGVGNSYYGIGNYPTALNYYQQSLKMKEEIKDSLGIGISFNNIAQIYYQQKQYDTAVVYLQKSMLIKEQMKDKSGMTYSLNNIAGVYFDQKKYATALQYHFKSLALKEELNDHRGIATSYNNIAQVYVVQKKYAEAANYYSKALSIEKQQKDQQGMVYSLNGLAKIGKETKKYDESNKNAIEALTIAKNINALAEQKDVYETLYQVAKLQGQTAKALTYFELYKAISDSLFNTEKMKVLNSLNSSYELNKHQQQIMLLQKDKILQESQLKLKEEEAKELRTYTLAFAVAFLSFGLLAFVLYQNNKQKEQINNTLTAKNKLIETQKFEIGESNEELKQVNEEFKITLDLMAQQKAEIEHKNENITSSINYARRIQNAVLPFKDYIEKSFGSGNFFVLYQPRDIVSGDFYWLHNTAINEDLGILSTQNISQTENQVILVVADCTGHGIPGAFMSMIGNELLNQIVVTNHLTAPDKILTNLHKGIRYALQQDVTASQDGMDVAVVTLTKNKIYSTENQPKFEKLDYAGAMNPLYFFAGDEQLQEVKATKKSIGGDRTTKDTSFVLHSIDLFNSQANLFVPLNFYLFTDGYQDQFGGENHKKFMSRNFKDLLQNIQGKNFQMQHHILQNTLTEWIKIGNEQQTDDITVLGVQVNG